MENDLNVICVCICNLFGKLP